MYQNLSNLDWIAGQKSDTWHYMEMLCTFADTELLDTISTNDYSTTPADSGISFENVAMEADA